MLNSCETIFVTLEWSLQNLVTIYLVPSIYFGGLYLQIAVTGTIKKSSPPAITAALKPCNLRKALLVLSRSCASANSVPAIGAPIKTPTAVNTHCIPIRVPITAGVGEMTGWAITTGFDEIRMPEKNPKMTHHTQNPALDLTPSQPKRRIMDETTLIVRRLADPSFAAVQGVVSRATIDPALRAASW